MQKPLCLVLVGPECTGKTTQARLLAEEFNAKLVKHVRIPSRFQMLSSVIDDINQQEQRTRWGGESLVIFDRWQVIDDIIYEKYCYNRVSLFEELLPHLAQMCKEVNILIVYFSIDEETMLRRFTGRGDNLRTVEEAKITRKAYIDFFNGAGRQLPFMEIDVSKASLSTINNTLKNIIRGRGKYE